jgi:nucleoside-diphosphate-sugar epimerase
MTVSGDDRKIPYAIFGACGAVGKALAAELAAARKPFRVVGRSTIRLKRDFAAYAPLAEYVEANLADGHAASVACEGVDTIFYTVGVPYDRFEQHPQLVRNAIEAAQSANATRFILVSNVYPYGLPQSEFVSETHPHDPNTFKGRMRKKQEDIVLSADHHYGLRTAVIRAPDFYGPQATNSFSHPLFTAALRCKRAKIVGPIDTLHEFLYVPDLARALIALAERPEAYGHAWNIAGPEPITTRRFAETVYAAAGCKRAKLAVAGKTLLRLAGFFDPIVREVVEMHYLWTNPVLLDDSRLRKLLPDIRKTPHEEGIRATLEALRA